MGLDVTAYSRIAKVAVENDDDGYNLGYAQASKNDNFPGRADEIEHNAWYSYEESCVGISRSYSGYGYWRNQLAELAGYPFDDNADESDKRGYASGAWKATEGPFWELINFADNEGAIGAAVSAKLAKDFAAFQAKADAHQDQFFRGGYADMRRAFELASNAGFVDFH
ncbi:MAG TPA: hypothetical protein VJU83_09670 [Burkholderiales bacterium]|nr:hypothetical protein [Burkholderiales bacterium]